MIAALTLLAGCGSSGVPAATAATSAGLTSAVSPTSGSNADGRSAEFNDVDDPTDRTFLTELRDKGVLPGDSGKPVPSATLTKDAKELCRLAGTSQTMGESEQYIRLGFTSARAGRAQTYGVTEAQMTDVMIISARVYCPESVDVVERALE